MSIVILSTDTLLQVLEQRTNTMKSTLAKGHAVLEGAEIIYLDMFDSPLRVAAYVRIGARAPARCVASAKTLRTRPRPTTGYQPKGETTSPRTTANNRIHP
jgi:DNA-binding IclR family transcriptional regulator